jgi:hypothetical protein
VCWLHNPTRTNTTAVLCCVAVVAHQRSPNTFANKHTPQGEHTHTHTASPAMRGHATNMNAKAVAPAACRQTSDSRNTHGNTPVSKSSKPS